MIDPQTKKTALAMGILTLCFVATQIRRFELPWVGWLLFFLLILVAFFGIGFGFYTGSKK